MKTSSKRSKKTTSSSNGLFARAFVRTRNYSHLCRILHTESLQEIENNVIIRGFIKVSHLDATA